MTPGGAVGRFAGVPLRTPWLPRAAASLLTAALLGAGTLLSLEIARADPPPLLVPTVGPAAAATSMTPTAPANLAPPAGTGKTASAFQFGKISISSDQMDLNNGSGTGNVVISSDTTNFSIHSDEYTATPGGGFEVSGQVELTMDAMRVLTRKLNYDAQRAAMVAEVVRMGKAPANVDAANFTLSNGQADLTNPTLFFGEPDPFGINIHAPSATYHANTDEVVMHGATVRLGVVPIFYLPSYTQGRASQPPISLQAHFGSRNDLGLYAQSTTFFTQNPEFAPGMLLDYYGKRGLLAGPAAKYDFTDNLDWWQDGTLESGFIHDTGNRGTDITGSPVPTNRFFLDWEHRGTLADLVDVTGTMSWWSDSNVLRDFRQGAWHDDQLPDNFVEASNRQENSLVSAFARFRPDDFEVVQERLPEVQYDYFPTPLGSTGIYQEGDADYVQLTQDNFNGTPTLHSNRLDGYYGWRRPINLGDAATITPVAGSAHHAVSGHTQRPGAVHADAGPGRLRQRDAPDGPLGLHERDLGHQRTAACPPAHPPISLHSRGAAGAGPHPGTLTSYVAPDYPPILDLGDTRNVDQMHSENVLRFWLGKPFANARQGLRHARLVFVQRLQRRAFSGCRRDQGFFQRVDGTGPHARVLAERGGGRPPGPGGRWPTAKCARARPSGMATAGACPSRPTSCSTRRTNTGWNPSFAFPSV